MAKEIAEQPEAVLDTLARRRAVRAARASARRPQPRPDATSPRIRRVVLIGMGTSFHAAMHRPHLHRALAGIPAEVDNASEYRYREPDHRRADTLVIAVSAVRRDGRHAGGDARGASAAAPRSSPSATRPARRPRASRDGTVYTALRPRGRRRVARRPSSARSPRCTCSPAISAHERGFLERRSARRGARATSRACPASSARR